MSSTASAPDDPGRRRLLGAAGALALAGCAPAGTSPGATGQDPARDDAGGGERPEEDGRILRVDGARVHFVRRGAGAPVVLIHGASGNLRDWTMSALPAIAAEREGIAFDRAGLGRSDWPGGAPATLSQQAGLMRGALRRLGRERALVVGHSYGGAVALAWALDAPESVAGLLLIAAPSQVWPGGLGLATDLLANPLTGPLLARAAPALLPRAVAEAAAARVFAPQDPPEDYVGRLGYGQVLAPGALRASARQLAALKDQIRVMVPRYPRLRMPVELLHGAADTIVPMHIHSEPLARQLAAARLTRLPGIGHMPHHAAAPAVLAALDRLEDAGRR